MRKITIAAGVAAGALALAGCGSDAAPGSARPSPAGTYHTPSGIATGVVTLTAGERQFVRDMRAKATTAVPGDPATDAILAGYGTSVCSEISAGLSPASYISEYVNTYGVTIPQLVALAQKDLCPPPPPPAPTMMSQTEVIVYSVTGSGDPTILIDTGNSQADLGSVSLPWQHTTPLVAGALYYALTAQLQGWGSIQDTVSEAVTTTCSNGVVKTESFPMANGSASGGYAIAQAEYTGGSDPGNESQAESDAGC